jgi:hypothetical protein
MRIGMAEAEEEAGTREGADKEARAAEEEDMEDTEAIGTKPGLR